ncbi:MAG: ubiquitin-like protein [Myxococcota bacterium]
MSISLSDVLDRVQSAQQRSTDTKKLLEVAAGPYAVFCKTVSGRTITINGMTLTTPVKTLMEEIAAKDGTPPKEQVLLYAGKVLAPQHPLALYNIQREVTIHCTRRLRGGYGEREAMQYVLDLNMRRGNVGKDILDTEGRSTAMKDFGRDLMKSHDFLMAIAKEEAPEGDYMAWLEKNWLHVNAIVQEMTHAGNCGDYASVVASHLIQETTDQWVYQVVMEGDCPGDCTFEEPHSFDHQLCVTYPTHKYKGKVPRSDDEMKNLTLEGMDANVAMVVDAWHNHRIISLKRWMDEGGNCYHRIGFRNLKILTKDKCGGAPLSPKTRKAIEKIVGKQIEKYEKSDQFVFDRFVAVWGQAPKADKKKLRKFVQKYHLAKDASEAAFQDMIGSLKAVFEKALIKMTEKVGKNYTGYAASEDKADYIAQLDKQMTEKGWTDPKKSAYLEAIYAQSGVETAACALLGAKNYKEYVGSQARQQARMTFGIRVSNELEDERSAQEIDGQMVTIPTGNWGLFEKEALNLSDEQLLAYAAFSLENFLRIVQREATRAELYRILSSTTSQMTVRCMKMMDTEMLDYVVEKEGANVFGTANEGRLHAVMFEHWFSRTDQAEMILLKLMTTEQQWRFLRSTDPNLVIGMVIPWFDEIVYDQIEAQSDANIRDICTWLDNSRFITAFGYNERTRAKIMAIPALEDRVIDQLAISPSLIAPHLSHAQIIKGFMRSSAHRSQMLSSGDMKSRLQTAILDQKKDAWDKVFDCGDDKVMQAVMALFNGTQLEEIKNTCSDAARENLNRLS